MQRLGVSLQCNRKSGVPGSLNSVDVATSFLRDYGYYDPVFMAYNMTAGDQTRMYGIGVGFVLIGSLVAGLISTPLGYKKGLILAGIICIIGPALQTISHVAAMTVGRAVMGFGIGLATVYVISYWSEVTTPAMRSRTTILYQLFIQLAGLVGACVNQGTHDMPSALAYQIPLIVSICIPVILLLLIWVVPESHSKEKNSPIVVLMTDWL
jgi:SP family sugar:H+ symporter-like MFS transporter